MDHIRANAKNWQNNKCKVIVCGYDNAFPWGSWGFHRRTVAVNRPSHLWRRKNCSWASGADRDFQIVMLSFSNRFIVEKSDDHAARFVFNGWNACGVHLGILAGSSTGGAPTIQIDAVQGVKLSGRCIADAKTGGVFDDDPGKKQAAKLDHAQD